MLKKQKNIVESSTLSAGGNMTIGDIYNYYAQENGNLFLVFIFAMTKNQIAEIEDTVFNDLIVENSKKLYIVDNDDKNEDINDFFNSRLGKQILKEYYDDSNYGWKPFVHQSPEVNNESIDKIISKIFEKRVTKYKCLYINENTTLDCLLTSNSDKKLFFEILERSLILIDPLSLTHPLYKEMIDEIYQSAEIGGIITTSCEFLPSNLKRFSNILLKRMTYRWHRNITNPNSSIYFKINNEKSLEKNILTICGKLGFKTSLDYFKNYNKDISNDTQLIDRLRK